MLKATVTVKSESEANSLREFIQGYFGAGSEVSISEDSTFGHLIATITITGCKCGATSQILTWYAHGFLQGLRKRIASQG